MARRITNSLSLLILVLALGGTLMAQGSKAALTGRVLDQTGAAIAGANVTLRWPARGFERTTTTNSAGAFSFDNLQAGSYRLNVAGRGFSLLTEELKLAEGEARSLDLSLKLNAIAEEIVVTTGQIANVPEVVRQIPGSVEVIDEATLSLSRVFTFSEALRKVAGINVRDEEGFGLRPNIGIRGLNPTRATKTLLLEDGLPLAYAPYGDNSSYYHPPVDRYQSIEVLKGSGQILYGPVTVGGVINYITPTPPERPAGSLTLIGGNRDYFNGHLNYGGTWKKTGWLFNYLRKQGEGARDNIRTGLNDFNFKSVTALGDRQAITTKFNYYGEDSNLTYSGLTEAEYRAKPRQNPFRNDFFFGDRFGASGTHAYVFNNDVVLSTSVYGMFFKRHWWRQSSNSGQRPNRLFNPARNTGDPDCLSMADLNTTCGNEGRLRQYYSFGVESRLRASHRLFGLRNETELGGRGHFENQNRRQENGDLPNSRHGVRAEHNERKNQAYSGFIQNRFRLGALTLTPGVRLEHVKYERTNRLLGVTGQTNLTQVVPGLGLAYSPTSKVTVFGGVHRGFAPPRTEDIINNSTGGSIDLDPELSWNYELGMRALPHAGLRFEATYFRLDYENQIVPASLAGGVGATLTNGGETLHEGAEVTARVDTGSLFGWRQNFYVRTAYTYLPTAKFTGSRFSSVSGFGNVSITGNRLPYAPEHLLNNTVGYSHPGGLDAFIEAVYLDAQFADDLNTLLPTADGQRGGIPSHTSWNATVNYQVEAINTTFFVTVKNLLDETFIVDRSRGILPSHPRLVQAGLKLNF